MAHQTGSKYPQAYTYDLPKIPPANSTVGNRLTNTNLSPKHSKEMKVTQRDHSK